MKDLRLLLVDSLERARRVRRYAAEGRDAFESSDMLQDAILRNLEVIGEAAKGIDEANRARWSHIPWRRMAGLRDVLIHAYREVELDAVWTVCEDDIPPAHREAGGSPLGAGRGSRVGALSLESHLVLNRWLRRRFGADGIVDLERDFQTLEPGIVGETPYLRALLERDGVQLSPERRSRGRWVEATSTSPWTSTHGSRPCPAEPCSRPPPFPGGSSTSRGRRRWRSWMSTSPTWTSGSTRTGEKAGISWCARATLPPSCVAAT